MVPPPKGANKKEHYQAERNKLTMRAIMALESGATRKVQIVCSPDQSFLRDLRDAGYVVREGGFIEHRRARFFTVEHSKEPK